MKKNKILALLNLIALSIHIALAYATQFKLINKKDVGEVSNQFPSLFTPAGITFSIWGVIYIGLLAFSIYHLLLAFRKSINHPGNRDLMRIGPWFILNNLAAATWLIIWTREQITASLILIFFQLITLIIVHLRTDIHDGSRELGSKIFTQVPLSIYLGWITIATIANSAVYLSMSTWDGFGFGYSDALWTRIMIAASVLITLIVILTRGNVTFGLVVLWALYGIVLKLEATNATMYAEIIETAWIAMGIVSFASVIQLFRNVLSRTTAGNARFPQSSAIKNIIQ